MTIFVNGEARPESGPLSVAGLIETLRLAGRLAVEVNGEIVPRSEYAACMLADGDRVEIVHAIGGG